MQEFLGRSNFSLLLARNYICTIILEQPSHTHLMFLLLLSHSLFLLFLSFVTKEEREKKFFQKLPWNCSLFIQIALFLFSLFIVPNCLADHSVCLQLLDLTLGDCVRYQTVQSFNYLKRLHLLGSTLKGCARYQTC